MLLTNLLLLFLVNLRFAYGCVFTCYLQSAVKCPVDGANNSSNSSALRLFFVSASKTQYYTRDHSHENRTLLELDSKTGVTAIDYSATRKRLYWISPRLGYWTRNSRVSSVSWDYRYACENEANAPWNDETLEDYWQSEGLERCCRHTVKSYDNKQKSKVLLENENWNPRSLALDYVGDKMYIADTTERSVKVYNLKGKAAATVFRDESLIPLEVVLDPPEGLMFVLAVNTQNQTMQIYRANMDGSSRILLDENDEDLGLFFVRSKVGFTIDTFKNRIYFSNVKKGLIESIDYRGNKRQIVVKAKYPTSISIYNRTLYWSDSKYDPTAMFMCDEEKCHLRTCKLNVTGACDESSIANFFEVSGQHIGVHEIKPIDPQLQPRVSNPCNDADVFCEHHCLLKSATDKSQSLGFSCACKDGYKLMTNGKYCVPRESVVTDILDDFYVSKNMNFTGLWNTPAKDDIFPISRNLLFRLFYEKPDTILYDAPFRFIRVDESDKLIGQELAPEDGISDRPQLNRMLSKFELERLSNMSTTLRFYSKRFIAPAIAYDWVTQKLYFVKSISAEDEEGELLVINYDPPTRASNKGSFIKRANKYGVKYTSKSDASLGKIPTPVSLVIHPYRGYVFAAIRNGSIVRLNSNGSNRLLFPNVNNSLTLTVDLNEDKLYWLDSDGYINFANLDGNECKRLLKTGLNATDVLYVYGKWLYARSEADNRVLRFDKLTGEKAGSLEIGTEQLYRESIGMSASAKDARQVDKSHPCVIDYCGDFCFGVPVEGNDDLKLRRQCQCGMYRKYREDDDECTSVSDDEDNIAIRSVQFKSG